MIGFRCYWVIIIRVLLLILRLFFEWLEILSAFKVVVELELAFSLQPTYYSLTVYVMVDLLSLFFKALLQAVIFALQKENLLLKISDILHFGDKLLAAHLSHCLQISFHSYKSLVVLLEGFFSLFKDLDFLFILLWHLRQIAFPSFIC